MQTKRVHAHAQQTGSLSHAIPLTRTNHTSFAVKRSEQLNGDSRSKYITGFIYIFINI